MNSNGSTTVYFWTPQLINKRQAPQLIIKTIFDTNTKMLSRILDEEKYEN